MLFFLRWLGSTATSFNLPYKVSICLHACIGFMVTRSRIITSPDRDSASHGITIGHSELLPKWIAGKRKIYRVQWEYDERDNCWMDIPETDGINTYMYHINTIYIWPGIDENALFSSGHFQLIPNQHKFITGHPNSSKIVSEQHIFLPRLISQMEPNFVLLFISIKNVFEIRKKHTF